MPVFLQRQQNVNCRMTIGMQFRNQRGDFLKTTNEGKEKMNKNPEEEVVIDIDEEQTQRVELYRKAAKNGIVDAQYMLAKCYADGSGIKKDLVKAASWYSSAAAQGHAAAQYELGLLHMNGIGVAQDQVEAEKCLCAAGERGHVQAQKYLREFYDKRYMEEESWSLKIKAAYWEEKTAQQGDPESQWRMGLFYKGRNPLNSVYWLQRAADHGAAEAMYELGLLYSSDEENNFFEQDCETAAKMFRKAAELGHVKSIYELGRYYYLGNDVDTDYNEAARLFRKAGELGNVDALLELSDFYTYGRGVEKDDAEALKLLQQAADLGDALAQCCLGTHYYNISDYVNAVEWYRKSAAQNYPEAEYMLGRCYDCGEGLPEDKAEALKYYRKAAAKDDDEAMYALYHRYLDGDGVVANQALAFYWLSKAAEGYNVYAEEERKCFFDELEAEDIPSEFKDEEL